MHGSKKKLTQAERRSLRSRAARQRGPEAEKHVPPRPLLCRKHDLNGKLHTAAWEGCNVRRVSNLVSRGANVEAVDEAGETALMIAAKKGHTDTVNVLAGTYNANVEAFDQNGWTALMRAAKNGHADTVNVLGTYNANVEAFDEDGWTALMFAAYYGHADTVNVLAGTYNANVEAATRDGGTALMFAAGNGHTDTVNALAGTHNANVEAVDQNGCTALMHAAYYGHADTVKWLKAISSRQTMAPIYTCTACQTSFFEELNSQRCQASHPTGDMGPTTSYAEFHHRLDNM